MSKYNHKKIEKKWQGVWEKNDATQINKDDNLKEKYYALDMFPYPSGDGLHMGHTENYTASDIYSRYKKMRGFNVLHPQGFDSFGLPTENYAIKTKIHPKKVTAKNIKNYIRQFKMLGMSHDLKNLVITSTPEYYKWTQWIFAKLFENDYAYKKTSFTNWCESCKTILANEQVENGACERCKNEVVQKEVPGWFFKTTDFADELIEGLNKIDWPEHTKVNQRNWIGRSEGVKITFKILNTDKNIKVFTTRPDTLFGCTYCALAPEHKLVQELKNNIENREEVEKYIKEVGKKTELERMEGKEKTGVELKGVKVINPANNEEIPIFIVDYVLAGYGTGAIMAVPAHDERDFEFAKKFGIEIKPVILKNEEKSRSFIMRTDEITKSALQKIGIEIVKKREDGFFEVFIPFEKLEDYKELIRQKMTPGFWNEFSTKKNFYFIFKHKNGKLEEFELTPKTNNQIDVYGRIFNDEEFKGESENVYSWLAENSFYKAILTSAENGVLINSEKFNGMESEEAKKAITEFVSGEMTNTYRLRDWSISRQRYWGAPIPIVYSPDGIARFVGEENLPWTLPEDVDFVPTGVAPLSKSKELFERTEKLFGKGWTPEVDTMDTFVDSSWYFLRYPDTHNNKEFCSSERLKRWLPVDTYIGGAEHTYMHLLYARFITKALNKIGVLNFDEPFLRLRHQGMVLDDMGVKMSKSKGNVVTPDEMVERYGADAVRMYMMFAGPLEDDVLWQENNIVGVYRFLEKVYEYANEWKIFTKNGKEIKNLHNKDIDLLLHKTIKKITEDIENFKYNTAISSLMILMNKIREARGDTSENQIFKKEQLELLLKLLSPFAPHITEELWAEIGNKNSIHLEKWPKYDKEKTRDKSITIAVQINGKVRGTFEIEVDNDEEKVKKEALSLPNVKKWTEGKSIKKIIVVPNKLVSIVTG